MYRLQCTVFMVGFFSNICVHSIYVSEDTLERHLKLISVYCSISDGTTNYSQQSDHEVELTPL